MSDFRSVTALIQSIEIEYYDDVRSARPLRDTELFARDSRRQHEHNTNVMDYIAEHFLTYSALVIQGEVCVYV